MSDRERNADNMDWLVRLLDERQEYAFGDLFRIVRASLQYRQFDGQMSRPLTRINFERGNSVGVLLYDPKQDVVILVRQFRYPVFAGQKTEGDAELSLPQAWLLEIVAGVHEKDHDAVAIARKELIEETGYHVDGPLQPIMTIYPSPGGTSERIELFLGLVDTEQRLGEGGGVASEGEDIQVVVLPLAEAMKMISQGEIQDAKTIIALQYLTLQVSSGKP